MSFRPVVLLLAFALLSACASAPRQEAPRAVVRPVVVPARPVVPVCRDCGRLERVEMVSNVRATPTGGAVLGGVVGGVVSGKPATPATGNRRGVQVLTFRLGVRMDDGRRLVLHQADLASGLKSGSRVRVTGGRVTPLR